MKMKMGVIKVIYGTLQSHFEEAPSGVTRQLYGAVRHCRDSLLHCRRRRRRGIIIIIIHPSPPTERTMRVR